MSLNAMISSIKSLFNSNGRKRRGESYIDEPPNKYSKKISESNYINYNKNYLQDDPSRIGYKSKLATMGSLFSKFKLNHKVSEPIEQDEYSDDEHVVYITKFKKSNNQDVKPIHVNNINHRFQMDNTNENIRSISTTKPIPALIPKTKFSRIPDLYSSHVNGHQFALDNNSHKLSLLNGNRVSTSKPLNISNCFNSVNSHNSKDSILTQHNGITDVGKYEELLRKCVSEYAPADKVLSPIEPTNSPTFNRNFVPSGRRSIRTSSVINLANSDLNRSTEETIRLLSESSIHNDKTKEVNSIRLKIDSIPVCQSSFPDNVNEKYSNAQRQRIEQISQQQKQSKSLSSTREKEVKLYENRLSNLRLSEIVILDAEVEEEVNDFPEFNDKQMTIIRQAMSGRMNGSLITKFNITITRDHIRTLQWQPLAWLNDEVINFYMNLLTERSELRSSDGYPKVYAMNTFFTQRLCSGGYSAVRRWTKKVDIFSYDIIPVPVHVGNVHWCMAIINMKEKSIKYYDSMGSPNQRVVIALEQYLKDESMDKRKISFDTSGWNIEHVADSPRQQNGSDCGVFSCMTAEFICRNRPIIFSQQHMEYFRQKMVVEICTGKMIL